MPIKQQIQADLKEALKNQKSAEVSTLRMFLASLITKEKDRRYQLIEKQKVDQSELEGKELLTDSDIVDILFGEIKKLKDTLVDSQKANRPDLAEKAEQEILVLQRYLPEQMSEEEIKKIVSEIIAATGAKDIKDMGRVIKEAVARTKGVTDSSSVSKIVKDLLIVK